MRNRLYSTNGLKRLTTSSTYTTALCQFNILVKFFGWVGGEELWNANWLEAFDEVYAWRGDGAALEEGDYEDGDLEDDTYQPPGSLQRIWTLYEGFTPDPEAEIVDEFKRLAEHQGWDKIEQKKQRPKFIAADFESYYGNNSRSLRNWRKLCGVCLIHPLPMTIDGCRDALGNVLVNIVNLVNNRRTGEPVLIFPTKRQFIDYTFPDRTYPLNDATRNDLMTSLLQPVCQKKYEEIADEEFEDYVAGRDLGRCAGYYNQLP